MLRGNELIDMGVPQGPAVGAGIRYANDLKSYGMDRIFITSFIGQIIENPESFVDDPLERVSPSGLEFAKELLHRGEEADKLRKAPVPYRTYGGEMIDPNAFEQMNVAMRLPVATSGALMPDAHLGYGLPIGGVLATENQIIPWAVGVDIGCSVALSVLDVYPIKRSNSVREALIEATVFGKGQEPRHKAEHPVLDHPEWRRNPYLRDNPHLRDKAWKQLGSSGGGNHFVEVGEYQKKNLLQGSWFDHAKLAILSHSGSRGFGATVANHFSKVAQRVHPDLPKVAKKLAWLELDTEEGEAYWGAMNLAAEYALANHNVIHGRVIQALDLSAGQVVETLKNSHNLAWVEEFGLVHRKGATPAAEGQLGIIPGSMTKGAYVVKGRGNKESLNSSAHGAGRIMSRRKAKEVLDMDTIRAQLEFMNIEVIGAAADEAPQVYKELDAVMAAQNSLVQTVGWFKPHVVRMADD